MDTLQDVQNTPPPAIDPQQYAPYQPTDLDYPSVLAHQEVSIAPGRGPHLQQPLSANVQSMYPPDHPGSLAIPIPSADVSPMDVVSASLSSSDAFANAMLSDFSDQTAGSAFSQDPQMNGIETLEAPHQLLSSPSATTSSTSVSHASSPAMNGMVPTYTSMGTSSLATALDGSRSRSGSSASPGHLSNTSSDIGFGPTAAVPPPPAHDNAFAFQPAFEANTYSAPATKESSPDEDDQQRQLLHNVLKQVAVAANTGSEAVSNGQTSQTANIVDELKKTLTWVSDMLRNLSVSEAIIAPTALLNGSPHAAPAGGAPSNHNSPPASTGLESAPVTHMNGMAAFGSSVNGTVEPTLLDADMSRKRCASTVAGDRVQKAMKLEPQDDVSLQMPPIHPPPPASLMSTSPVFSYTTPASIPPTMSTIVEHPPIPALPPSLPVSRPPSSSGLPSHALNLMADIQQAHPTVPFPSSVDFNPQLSSTDFPTLSSAAPSVSAPASIPAALAAPIFSPAAPAAAASAVPSAWPESRPLVTRHAHSLSGSASVLPTNVLTSVPHTALPLVTTNMPFTPTNGSFNSPTHSTHPSQSAIPAAVAPPATIGRISRSSSISHPTPFAFGLDAAAAGGAPPPIVPAKAFEGPALHSRPSTSGLRTRPPSPDYGGEDDYDGEDSDDDLHMHNAMGPHGGSPLTPPSATGEDAKGETNASSGPSGRRGSRTSPSAEGGAALNHNNEVPQEYRADVERIFFEFLNRTCSNLDATDAKGEPIHQTLMAKKMQRLDESPDFRPFKFRIQAFTNAFLEELARQGFPEEKIPMKKIRNFLWNQPYISRFNEEGKKSKSKGNHIWHVDAKKSEGGWLFRPFQRKLAGAPPGVAYIGLRWSWTPRIWDPQASRANMPVKFTSPNLPSWLTWNGETLSGIPPHDAENCDVTVEARFIQDGQEETLGHTVHLTIAPMAAVDASFTPSRRPSLVGDLTNPRRILSDSVLPQTSPPRLRAPTALAPAPIIAPDSQVVQVLTSAAQRVAQEAQSQVVASSSSELGPELHSLAKQQHVLTVTANAFNNKSSAEPPAGSTAASSALTAAAQQVVLQAARQVAADRTVAAVTSGIPAAQAVTTQVTVKEVSVATQSAVAQAVDLVGPLSSEVDVLMTAKTLLQQQTIVQQHQARTSALVDPPIPVPLDPVRPHSTGTIPFPPQAPVAPPPVPAFFPHAT